MDVDHIFIMSNASYADRLVEAGLTEGSGRTHQGIGTKNRRFFFEDFYLEMLWVHNAQEAQSQTGLGIWERFNHTVTGYSPFGLCLKNTPDTDPLFQNAIRWQPEFLPPGKTVDIITNEHMPWIFRFPKQSQKNLDEPRAHAGGTSRLINAVFKLKKLERTRIIEEIERACVVEFQQSDSNHLVLEFDFAQPFKGRTLTSSMLTIKF